jgi:hypothetical protein
MPRERRVHYPVVQSSCADCAVGTIRAGEWYVVRDEIWNEAWAGRRKPWHALPGQEILCIGCLEKRLGRALGPDDFADMPINNPTGRNVSARLLDRLNAGRTPPSTAEEPVKRKRGRPKGSKNRPKVTVAAPPVIKRRRGRPPHKAPPGAVSPAADSGSKGDARERHGLYRCGAFVAARLRRPFDP